jgi:hypothetical protein
MGIIVKIKKGTGDRICHCDNWLAHYERFSKQKANYCSVSTCWRTDIIGAHVYQVDSSNKNVYIVPLCKEHYKSTQALDVGIHLLISSDVKETCGKQS